jgi:hypothetical protein
LGTIAATCNLPNAGGCQAIYNQSFTGPVRINGDWGSGDLTGPNPPAFLDRNAFANPAAYTYGDTPLTGVYGLRAPHAINQDLSLKRTFAIRESMRFSIAMGCVQRVQLCPFRGALGESGIHRFRKDHESG